MLVAYSCILIAFLLPYVWVVFAKTGAPGYNNKDPRGWIAKQDSIRVRAGNAAQLNAFEAFAPFAAAVLMAQFGAVAVELITVLAVVFIVCRVLHGIFYLSGAQALRSLVWFGGFLCILVLMGSAIYNLATV